MSYKHRGFSLMELLFVIVLVAIITATVFGYLAQNKASIRMETFRGHVTEFVSNIQHIKPGLDYNGITTAAILAVSPKDWQATDGTIHHDFGGEISVSLAAYKGVNDGILTINMPDISQQDCADAILAIELLFITVTVNDNLIKQAGQHRITNTAASNACDAELNTIKTQLL